MFYSKGTYSHKRVIRECSTQRVESQESHRRMFYLKGVVIGESQESVLLKGYVQSQES